MKYIQNKEDPKFVKDCWACESETDVSLSWRDRDGRHETSAGEDDGALIVRKRGIRVVFTIGQDRPLREQNERIQKVLKFLKMEKFLEKCLHSDESIEEEEAEDDECPHCGRSGGRCW